MFLRLLLRRVLAVLVPLALTSTLYLYLYPLFHGCAFPLPDDSPSPIPLLSIPHLSPSFLTTLRGHLSPSLSSASPSDSPIFRLLVLADPQLEGDSSLPKPHEQLPARLSNYYADLRSSLRTKPPSATLSTLRSVLRSLVHDDVPRAFRAARKRLDLLGNDYYLAHIYRTLHWWSVPTHVTVLGDLIGSQWVSEGEFEARGERFWERVFRGGKRVEDHISHGMGVEVLGEDGGWDKRVVNVVGNHDVGYAGDVSRGRIERFERVFGKGEWDVKFRLPSSSSLSVNGEEGEEKEGESPTIHLINLNSLILDTPALDPDIQATAYEYLNGLLDQRSPPVTGDRNRTFTLLLTHLPLHKKEGVCTDAPYFAFHEEDDSQDEPRFYESGLKEQNHLSEYVSANAVLEGVFGMSGDESVPGGGWGRNGLILTGHDHTGCDVVHFVNRTVGEESEWGWDAVGYGDLESNKEKSMGVPAIREVTMRSMMGEYGGYAGLLSVWFDGEWQYRIQMCAAGVQHVWWAVHVLDVVTAVLVLIFLCGSGQASSVVSAGKDTQARRKTKEKEKKEQ
ncbi:hypothetical protein BO94DRAFT_538809 [Aspergillus sclerotioniger CBS 115572]|uniref:Polarized growth protein n=1 Tax=Aspergillus sclerotioniger CBS 115572 TaxID=1450535 RepID=A0A317VHC9_9EURO|nr:hypothetical protein BO94DRAFT_538809 [Aspergillus sclerotioniger CBS 115572]PWY73766.1 hypothetical protein BO94DRAFT_538809 [Aspergillus sclerotioniger CBS 115572]